MSRKLAPLAAAALSLVCLSLGIAAPKPGETPEEKRDKAVKEFSVELLTALGKHDFGTFVGLCEVPFNIQPSTSVASGIRTTKDGFKEDLESRYMGLPTFDGSKHVVRSVRTLKQAKNRFLDQQAEDAAAVLTEDGLVVHVELHGDRKVTHLRLLVREKDGQLRLVGIQTAEKDE
jgi:hypothetical protein